MTTAAVAPQADLLTHSRQLIAALQTPEGAYPASPEFSAYRGYCWFRDGAFIADGMSAAGEHDSALRFFGWCANVVERCAPTIAMAAEAERQGEALPGSQMLPARFTFAGDPGNDEWWDFQLDGFGTWLWALREHSTRVATNLAPHSHAIELTVRYLLASWNRPCYDWWEEYAEHRHVSTLGCIAVGLTAAVELGTLDRQLANQAARVAQEIMDLIRAEGVRDGHLVKWLGSTEVDGSLLALIAPLRAIDPSDPIAAATVAAVEHDLAVDGGVHRYRDDTFYGGGQWPLLSCFAGLASLALGNRERSQAYYAWAASTATDDLDLPEQVPAHLLAPHRRQEWIERWGTVATPLLWSHAMVLRLGSELNA
jgi:GH15 family glucan-1,4-alpha-glucosidase